MLSCAASGSSCNNIKKKGKTTSDCDAVSVEEDWLRHNLITAFCKRPGE